MKNDLIQSTEFKISLLLFLPSAILGFYKITAQYAIVSTIFISIFIFYIEDLKFRKIASSFPAVLFLTLMLYHCINAFYKKVPGFNAIDILHGIKLFSCLVIISFWACKDFLKTIKILLLTYLARCIIVLFFSLIISDYSETERITGVGGSATGLGQMAALTGIFIVYLNSLNRVSVKNNILFFILPICVIVLSQTRNALAMIMISIFTTFFLFSQGRKHVSLIRALPLFLLVVAIPLQAMTILNNTHFGQRFQSGFEDAYYHKYSTGTFFDIIVGDRVVYYVRGWDFFMESPITGIGMYNYKNLTGGIYPLHSEYMVQLCEGGIIGAVLWLTFIGFMFFVISKYIKNTKIKVAAFSSMIVLLFCAIYAREFWGEIFYPIYSLILSSYFKNKLFNKKMTIIKRVMIQRN